MSLETTGGTSTLLEDLRSIFIGNGPRWHFAPSCSPDCRLDRCCDRSDRRPVLNATSVVAEGFFRQDANISGVAVIDDFEAAALANANAFEANASSIQLVCSPVIRVLHLDFTLGRERRLITRRATWI